MIGDAKNLGFTRSIFNSSKSIHLLFSQSCPVAQSTASVVSKQVSLSRSFLQVLTLTLLSTSQIVWPSSTHSTPL